MRPLVLAFPPPRVWYVRAPFDLPTLFLYIVIVCLLVFNQNGPVRWWYVFPGYVFRRFVPEYFFFRQICARTEGGTVASHLARPTPPPTRLLTANRLCVGSASTFGCVAVLGGIVLDAVL